MDTLREEILQAQRVRSDLLKWKLVLVGGVGAVGLGLAGADGPANADLVLAAIPPACVYVDLLCRHLSLRMLVLGKVIRDEGTGILQTYEARAHEHRYAFALEEWAIAWSTLAVSIAVLIYGLEVDRPDHAELVFGLSGAGGLVFTALAWWRFETLCSKLGKAGVAKPKEP